MSRPMLGDLELMELSYVGFDHPTRAMVVPLLAADLATSGNAVLQSSALGFRQAQITWLADGQDDVDTARGYYEALSEQTYTDYADVDHTVRVIAFSAALRVGDFWDCAATLLELA